MVDTKSLSRWIEDLRNAFDPPLDIEKLMLLERWVKESDPAASVDLEAGAARVRAGVMEAIVEECD